jgi:hypothetical protein
MRQAVFVALGLALGVGLVVTVAATSTGVKNAESQVLGVLDGVGTDVTVTGVAPSPSAAGSVPQGAPTGLSEGPNGVEECFAGGSCTSVAGKTISFVNAPYSLIREPEPEPHGGRVPAPLRPLQRDRARRSPSAARRVGRRSARQLADRPTPPSHRPGPGRVN